MRALVTVEWITARDTEGLVADSTSLEDAITRVSYDLCNRVGHDWGDSTSAEYVDGVRSPTLFLAGKTPYPLRSVESMTLDDYDEDIADLIFYRERSIGNLITKIRMKAATWDCYQVMIDGVWGWADTPDDVKEAVYRLVVLEITGKPYGKRKSASAIVYNAQAIKRVKQPDGVEIEFNAPSVQMSTAEMTATTGDDFADEVVQRYRWQSCGGVV